MDPPFFIVPVETKRYLFFFVLGERTETGCQRALEPGMSEWAVEPRFNGAK